MQAGARNQGLVLTRALPFSLRELAEQMQPCANPWCTKFSHRRGRLCAFCEEITSGGVFLERLLIHLSWNPDTWRLRLSLSARELLWAPNGTWELQSLPGSPFPRVVKASAVTSFALGGRLMCRLPPGRYSVAWRLARAPTEEELPKANKAHRVWGLAHSRQSCFSWKQPALESRLRCTTAAGQGPVQARTVEVRQDTVCMIGGWSEVVVGSILLEAPDAEEEGLCSATCEIELHFTSAKPRHCLRVHKGLYFDSVVLSQIEETDSRKLFSDVAKVIREAKAVCAED